MAWWLFLVNKKEIFLFHLLLEKYSFWVLNEWMTNELLPGGNISWWLKILDKKPLVCHGQFWLCHEHNFRNCHRLFSFVTHMACFDLFRTGNSSSVTGKIRGFLSRALLQSYGHFFEKCHGQTEKCHGKKNTARGR